MVARCSSHMAFCYAQQRRFTLALQCSERALLMGERTLNSLHPILAHYHKILAQILISMKHRDLQRALRHAQAARHIISNARPSHDPHTIDIHSLLGHIYSLMRNDEESMVWFRKALESDQAQPIDAVDQQKRLRHITYICLCCHQYMWIYQCFEWMKNTRFNCLVFHRLPYACSDLRRRLGNH